MKKVSTSIILASTNLALLGFGYLDNWLDISRHLPARISILPMAIAFAVIPPLFLFTVIVAIADLFRGHRWQGTLGLILSIPIAIIYSHPH